MRLLFPAGLRGAEEVILSEEHVDLTPETPFTALDVAVSEDLETELTVCREEEEEEEDGLVAVAEGLVSSVAVVDLCLGAGVVLSRDVSCMEEMAMLRLSVAALLTAEPPLENCRAGLEELVATGVWGLGCLGVVLVRPAWGRGLVGFKVLTAGGRGLAVLGVLTAGGWDLGGLGVEVWGSGVGMGRLVGVVELWESI